MTISTLVGGQPREPMFDQHGRFTAPWASWISSAHRVINAQGSAGPTTNRPTSGLYVGQRFYDSTLGYPVWVHQISPSIIWHNGAGAAV